jgi:predicted nucleotidyltransferase
VTRTPRLDLPADELRLVLAILAVNLPDGATAWVFGSRATGRARRYSDLDLAVDAGRPLTLDETARLSEAFRDSDLPYRVDLADWQSIDDHFRQVVAADRTPLAEEAGHGGEEAPDPAMTVRPPHRLE